MLRGVLWFRSLFRPRDAALAVPHPVIVTLTLLLDHYRKAEADHEQTQTPNSHTDLFSISCGSAVALGMDTLSCRRMYSPHGRAARRGVTVRRAGTASSDAVPQMRGCRILSPSASQHRLTRNTSDIHLCAPYLFGMVNNSEPSHKCHSREVCGEVGRLTQPRW